MFELIGDIICILDGVIVGKGVLALIKKYLGNTAVARLLNVIGVIVFGIGYSVLTFQLSYGYSDLPDAVLYIIIFAPVSIALLRALIIYIASGTKYQ